MGKRAVLIGFIVILIVLAYVGYHTYDDKRAGAKGDVFPRDAAIERVDNRTDTNAKREQPSGQESVVYPQTTPGQASAASAGPTSETQQTTQSMQPVPASAPPGDTISPNPPNGMVFSGSGRYQFYRQGNITWRLNTDTGRTCIIFATEEEWKKPQVYRAGCGKT